jgi:hypothetical protein
MARLADAVAQEHLLNRVPRANCHAACAVDKNWGVRWNATLLG